MSKERDCIWAGGGTQRCSASSSKLEMEFAASKRHEIRSYCWGASAWCVANQLWDMLLWKLLPPGGASNSL